MTTYDPSTIEKKWQDRWRSEKISETKDSEKGKENRLLLVEFPYPSGNLHMGHWYAFALPDMQARYLRMKGYNVMYPIGFDAFGLPAENAAIKRGIHPREWTEQNIATMSAQLESMGAMFDWSRVVSTIDPAYYRWTQWIFLKMYEKGLAYRSATKANWCPKDKTVLANEQVVDGACERCGTAVTQKEIEQWMFKITAYADRLIDDIEGLDWPQTTVLAQRNWIGRSEGAIVRFHTFLTEIFQTNIEVFTTRPDTIFGVTAVVISPELAQKWIDVGWQTSDEARAYIKNALSKRELDRMEQAAEKTGVPAGISATNPANDEKVPVWIADYVLGHYGTGAVMMVPAHDERDFEFAKKFDVPVRFVIEPTFGESQGDDHHKKAAFIILRNPKNNTAVVLDWGPRQARHGGKMLIGGGLEEGETYQHAAEREIVEETGYKNFRFVAESDFLGHGYFYSNVKGKNMHVTGKGLLYDLVDEERIATHLDDGEKDKFTVTWQPMHVIVDMLDDGIHEAHFRYLALGQIYTGRGILTNSGTFDGLDSEKARQEIVEHLERKGVGEFKKTYRLHDWILSRQRYWGVPIPMVKCAACALRDPSGQGYVPVPEAQLPVELPPLDDFLPTDDGRSPLAKAESWLKVACPKCGQQAERETDTMDTFVDSSWYFIRYTDPKNVETFADKKKMQAWLPVPMYVGGAEHNTMHLLYSRFFSKVLYDLGHLPALESTKGDPFFARRNHGIVLGPDGQKMSKSKGNVIDPDKEVAQYGADTVRMYLGFAGPYEQDVVWDPKGINGVYRFLSRVWKLAHRGGFATSSSAAAEKTVHAAIKKVSEDLASLRFNTAVSELMKTLNVLEDAEISLPAIETFLKILAPLAPHLAEELWQGPLGHDTSIHLESWPEYDEKLLIDEEIELPVQVNGKVRDTIKVPADASEDQLKDMALTSAAVRKYLEGKEPKKIIIVPKRLISIVV